MKKKKSKVVWIVIAIVMVLVLGIGMVGCMLSSGEAAAVVTTTTVTRGELQESISTSGTVASEEVKVCFAPISGKVAEVEVAAGDGVAAGEVMVSFDVQEMEKTFAQATLQQKKTEAGYNGMLADSSESQAKLNEANTNLAVLNQQIADTESYLKELQKNLEDTQRNTVNNLAGESYNLTQRLEQLQAELKGMDKTADPEGYAAKAAEVQQVSDQLSRNQYVQSVYSTSDQVAGMQSEIAEVQERLAGYEEYKARMESQKTSGEAAVMDSYDKIQYEADKELAAMSYRDAEADYHMAQQGIRAEFNGIVTACTVVEGAMVAEGTQLLTLENSEKVKVTLQASKQDVEKLEVGQKATIVISGYTYEGKVQKINRMATVNASNTPMVGVEVHIDNPDENIILGMDAKLQIYTRKAENALLIPVEAINADRDGDFLYIVENGVIVKRPVVCGISTDTYTEIVEGVSEGEEIVLTAYTDLEEGMAVTVMPNMQMGLQ